MSNYIQLIILILMNIGIAQKILIPMDIKQTNHLKAYGIAYSSLKNINKVEWLLNYRGGSFVLDASNYIKKQCLLKNVYYENLTIEDISIIYSTIEEENMEIVVLEKAPKIAVYSPPDQQPWDDAVTLALTYADINYEVVFDDEVINGELYKYDWLHLHHEDFTGQYGKFYRYRNQPWYKEMERSFTKTANKYGFKTVHQFKKTIALKIRDYINNGGFLFAMCSATDSFDIALSFYNVDFAHSVYDGTPIDKINISNIDYSNGKRIREYLVLKDGSGFMEINKVYGTLDGSWTKWYADGKKEEEGKYKGGIKVGTWSRFSMTGTIVEEWNYDTKGRNLYEITYYDNGTVKEYRDFFSKTIQEYNVDGSIKGDKIPFN